MRALLLSTGATLAFGAQALAADTYHFDKTHTNIMWFASHFGFSDSMGQFMEYDGKIVLDEANPEASSVEVVIQTGSIMTGLPKFDEHLKSADFFDVAKHPTATFTSNKIEKTGDNTAKIHGAFTMLGKTHPLTLDATLNKLGENPFNKQQTVGFTVKGTIDRSQYGMNYAIPGIPAEVDLLIETEAVLATEAAQ